MEKPKARLTAPPVAVKIALDLGSLCMDCNPRFVGHFFTLYTIAEMCRGTLPAVWRLLGQKSHLAAKHL